MFTGLSAFPLTPMTDGAVDEAAFARLVERLAAAGVDSIGALGSTGSAVYLSADERGRAAEIAVQAAGGVPVIVGTGALRTADVIRLTEGAQRAGAVGALIAPVSYQPLTDEEVVGLYADVAAATDLPVVVYENPRTTGFTFSDEVRAAVAGLPHVASVKVPSASEHPGQARTRIESIRRTLPDGVTLGVSGDATAPNALRAGADAWYSVIGGLLPEQTLEVQRAASSGDDASCTAALNRLSPFWELFADHGAVRVVARAAELLGLVGPASLPRPLRPVSDDVVPAIRAALTRAGA